MTNDPHIAEWIALIESKGIMGWRPMPMDQSAPVTTFSRTYKRSDIVVSRGSVVTVRRGCGHKDVAAIAAASAAASGSVRKVA